MEGGSHQTTAPERADELLSRWEQRSILALLAHARSANRCSSWDLWLGVAGAALTAAVGTGIFATIRNDVSTTVRAIVGIVTVAAAIFTSVHTFAALGQRTEIYERASRRHAAVRRRIELVRARLAAGEDFDVWAEVEGIKAEIDEAAASTGNASRRIWNRTRREVRNELTRWERLRRRLSGLPTRSRLGSSEDQGGPLPPLNSGQND